MDPNHSRPTSQSSVGGSSSRSLTKEQFPSPYVDPENDRAKGILRKRYITQYRKHHQAASRSLAAIGRSHGVDEQIIRREVEGNIRTLENVPHKLEGEEGDEDRSKGSSSLSDPSTSSPAPPSPTEFKFPKFFPPPLTSRERANLEPLSRPVAIPQRIAGNLQSRFVRAYSPDLALAGIDEDTWLSFLDGFAKTLKGNMVVRAIGVAGDVAAMTPIVFPLRMMGRWVTSTTDAIGGTQGKAEADAFLSHANDVLFAPRGLVAVVVSSKFKDQIIATRRRQEEGDSTIPPPSSSSFSFDDYQGFVPFQGISREPSSQNSQNAKTRLEEHEGYASYSQAVESLQPNSMLLRSQEGFADLKDCEKSNQEKKDMKSKIGGFFSKRRHERAIQREEIKIQQAEYESTQEQDGPGGNRDERIQNKGKEVENPREKRLWLIILNLTPEDRLAEAARLQENQRPELDPPSPPNRFFDSSPPAYNPAEAPPSRALEKDTS